MNPFKIISKTVLFFMIGLNIQCASDTMTKFIPSNLPLEKGNYSLIVNTNGTYGLIDDPNLLIENRDAISSKYDVLKLIPGEGKPTHSIALYKEKEQIKFASVIDKDKLILGNLREHLKPLKKITIQGNKKQIEATQNSITSKTIYYLNKPHFKHYQYSFNIHLPTLMVKAKFPLDENGKDPFINGNYAMDTERKKINTAIKNRIIERFPKGEFEIESVGSGSTRGTFLMTANAIRVRDTLQKFLNDEDQYYYFNPYVNIICSPAYYQKLNTINLTEFFAGISKINESNLQEFIAQKDISKVDTITYPPPYFLEVQKTSYQQSAIQEIEYNFIYLIKKNAIKNQ